MLDIGLCAVTCPRQTGTSNICVRAAVVMRRRESAIAREVACAD